MNYIIVGLGNPGDAYIETRHNAGRMVLEFFKNKHGFLDWEYRKELKARKTEGVLSGSLITLLQPDDYMNNSGKSVIKYIKNFSSEELENMELVVVYDDIDLPLGTFKLSHNRGSGGHNGVASVIKELKSKDFIRVRIGIAPLTFFGKMRKPKGSHSVQKHVLKKFTKAESQKLELVLRDSTKALEDVVVDGVEKAMNLWN